MSVLALITRADDIGHVIPWAAHYAQSLDATLTVLCWAYVPMSGQESSTGRHSCELLREQVYGKLHSDAVGPSGVPAGVSAAAEVLTRCHPSPAKAAIELTQRSDIDLIVAAGEDESGRSGASYASNELLRDANCHTVILFGGGGRSHEPRRLLVGATDSPHDSDALFLASEMARSMRCSVTLARTEFGDDQVLLEVGRRELKALMREAGVEDSARYECRVFPLSDRLGIATALNDADLVLLGANTPQVAKIVELTDRPTIAVIKRAPPLRTRKSLARLLRMEESGIDWGPQLSPADYADLLQGLRRGSRLSQDFLTMLCLAAVVASLGLLQNSAAVVIGSMLLAPLMTPMLGCGLALAQANPKLGNTALHTVGVGLMCTLVIGFLIGVITPGVDLTQQILARGNPTTLDLMVALASAAAAAYSLARPNLTSSIAGVAIATALVPPLCSVGLSLAYRDYYNAMGASMLFLTNFVAIVLCAALSFRLMGITSSGTGRSQRKWVLRTTTILLFIALTLAVPLYLALQQSIVSPQNQPRFFPLAGPVMDALEQHVGSDPEVELIAAGHPSSAHRKADVVVVLGAPRDVDASYSADIVSLIRREMRDEQVSVEVRCLRQLWHSFAE